MESAELVRLYPHLFHMAADGSWPSIQRHGLLSSAALVSRWGRPENDESIAQKRRTSLVIDHPDHGRAVLRDQAPIHVASMEAALGGSMTVAEWLRELNSRVFFFLDPASLFGMLSSPTYRNDAHTVLTIDTASFVAAHEAEIELTDMNTGWAQPHNHKQRGLNTFQPLADFKHPQRAHAYSVKKREVVEMCVPHSVPDVVDHVVHVERYRRREQLPLP